MDPPSHGLLQDAGPSSSAGRFRPYASAKHRVTRGRYITSNDRRGYIPVYEYPLNGQWIMMDIDDGYILWTGIWKALGNAKADIVKMLESQPDLAPQLRRVRGGYLKIQGTWMPYEVALRLARRVAWTIREDLIPLFGPTFPATCLSPDQPGYGQILGSQQGKRRGRRAAVPLPLSATLPPPQPSDSDTSPGNRGQQTRNPGPSSLPPLSAVTSGERPSHLLSPSQIAGPSRIRHEEFHDEAHYSGEGSSIMRSSYAGVRSQFPDHAALGQTPPWPAQKSYGHPISEDAHHFVPSFGPIRESAADIAMHNSRDRFSPYQSVVHSRRRSGVITGHAIPRPSPVDLPPLSIPSSQPRSGSITGSGVQSVDLALTHRVSASWTSAPGHRELITLPPININSPGDPISDTPRRPSQGSSGYSLPPISALSDLPPLPTSGASSYRFDSAAVLRRLALDDDEFGDGRRSSFVSTGDGERSYGDIGDDNTDTMDVPTQEQLSRRRRSLSEPLLQSDPHSRSQPTGLAAPEIILNSSSDISSQRTYPDSLSARTDATEPDARYTNVWNSSSSTRRVGFSFRHRYDRPLSDSREGLESDVATTDEVTAPSPAPSSRTERSSRVGVGAVLDGTRNPYARFEGYHTEQEPAPTKPPEPSRPHDNSQTPAPLQYREHSQFSPVHMRQDAVEVSSYRFSINESPSGREDASTPPYLSRRRTRDNGITISGFHSPSPARYTN